MPSHANHPWRLRIAGGLLSGAAAGVAATVATRALGHRRRGATSPELDALARPLDDAQVIHHELRTADGGRLHAAESGRPTGRPVVFMHGVTLQWWVWTAVMRLAGDRFRCVAWDMRGHGRSIPGRDGVTLDLDARVTISAAGLGYRSGRWSRDDTDCADNVAQLLDRGNPGCSREHHATGLSSQL